MLLSQKRVLVTGGAGFLGRHLVRKLRQRGCAEIHVPRSASCDLVDPHGVRVLFSAFRPDVVIHLAAKVGGIGANAKFPGTYFHDNMVMGVNILEQARQAGVEKVVLAGTICSYPKLAPVPFHEDDLWNGFPEETNAPYGVAKKALMVMAAAYRQQFGVNTVCLLPVNLYGPHDNFDLETSHVIPAMIRKFAEAKRSGESEVVLWGDGSPTREFLYVEDCADALILASEQWNDSEPINVGTGREIAIRDLAVLIAARVGYRGALRWDATRPNGQPRRSLDTARAWERLGFRAAVSLEEGIDRTVRWYQMQCEERGA